MTFPRVYPILDTQSLVAKACDFESAAAAWLEAGVAILQFRHKGAWTREIVGQAERIGARCRSRAVKFVVNDRADVAKLLEAGLHLGQEDLTPKDARRLVGPAALLGYSTHNPEQLEAAAREPVDYIALGPVFGTRSKEKPDPVIGVSELRRFRAPGGKPLVAIGGITRANAPAVFSAGADSVAVIADLLPEPCTGASLRRRMEEWLQLAQN
jgi:thiamine-phosphate pyrophosphorylase